MGRADPFEKLHIYEVAIIAELLPPVDVVRLRRVSKTWNEVLGSEYICKVALQAHFPHSKETRELHQKNATTTVFPVTTSELIVEGSVEEPPAKRLARSKGKGKGKPKAKPKLTEFRSIVSGLARRPVSAATLGFSRATFRLHSRAVARPTKVHKYRLHHICDRGFASTARHLFWCESNRKIWQQKIGEGIGGRRGLKLGSVGNRIAHVHQITAVENVPGRNGSGLVVLLFREVLTWGLEMAALDYETDEVVWKVSLADSPSSLQRTKGWVHYLTQTQLPASTAPGSHGVITQEYRYTLVVHCILTGNVLSRTFLSDSWPTQKRAGYPNYLPEVPGAYTVFPTSNLGRGKPEKMVVAFEDRGSKIPGEEVSKKAAYKVLVYSLGNGFGEDGTLLKEIELERSGIGIGMALLDKSIRMEFSSGPCSRNGYPNLLLIESTSHPHVIPPKTRNSTEKLEYPTLSVWTLETLNFDILEIRRYQSRYADDEMRPALESREGFYGGPMAEYTRMEALNVDSGVSWVIYDENKGFGKGMASSDLEGSDDDSDDDEATSFPVIRAWNHFQSHPGQKLPISARIDTVGYEEVPEGGWTGPWLDNFKEEGTPPASRNLKRKRDSSMSIERPGSASSDFSSSTNSLASSATTVSTLFPEGSPTAGSSSSSSLAVPPKERWFRQTSRHKLQQPEIMRRRRRHNLGEEEEDWGLMPVRTNPTIFLGGGGGGRGGRAAGGMGGLETDDDGRYLVVLTRIKGWSSMALCLDFEPEW